MPQSFKITETHMEAFSKQQEERFEDEMVVHLTREFPDEANRMGEAGRRKALRYSWQTDPGGRPIGQGV